MVTWRWIRHPAQIGEVAYQLGLTRFEVDWIEKDFSGVQLPTEQLVSIRL